MFLFSRQIMGDQKIWTFISSVVLSENFMVTPNFCNLLTSQILVQNIASWLKSCRKIW